MPRGPKGEKRPTDVIARAVLIRPLDADGREVHAAIKATPNDSACGFGRRRSDPAELTIPQYVRLGSSSHSRGASHE